MPISENNVNVTVAIPRSERDWLVHFAQATGHTRTHPQTGEVDGNQSWSINEAISFLRTHMDQYMAERSKRLVSELEGGGDE